MSMLLGLQKSWQQMFEMGLRQRLMFVEFSETFRC